MSAAFILFCIGAALVISLMQPQFSIRIGRLKLWIGGEPKNSGIELSEESRQTILGALDSLATALADHDHQWTDGERTIYEQATQELGVPPTKPPEDE